MRRALKSAKELPFCNGVAFLRSLAQRAALATWAVGMSVVLAALMMAHLVAFKTPPLDSPKLRATLAALPPSSSSFTMLHALRAGCVCSERIARHLVHRGVASGVREHVLVAGDAPKLVHELQVAGFSVEPTSEEGLAERLGLDGAPLLVIAGRDGTVRYAGGYTSTKQGPAIVDLPILARVREGETVAALPLFGCPVGVESRAKADPLGIR